MLPLYNRCKRYGHILLTMVQPLGAFVVIFITDEFVEYTVLRLIRWVATLVMNVTTKVTNTPKGCNIVVQ